MRVVLLRHGRTEANRKGAYHGRTDDPLCEEGVIQAKEVGCRPEVSQVFVSPMRRARQTAELFFPNAEQIVLDDLREMDFGDFEGRTADEMEHDPAYRAWVDGNCLTDCPNGEGVTGFTARVCAAFDKAVRETIAAGENTLWLVAHGGTLMSILSTYAEQPGSYYDWYVGNCQGWQAVLKEENRGDSIVLYDCTRVHRLRELSNG